MPVINGSGNADTLNGTAGVDTINGLAGDDVLRGLGGNDTLDGGSGFDQIEYQNDSLTGGLAAVTVNLGLGTATDGFGNTDTLISIEAVRGTALGDLLIGSNRTDEAEHFQGLAGNDTINGQGGNDEVRYDRDANFGGSGAVTVNLTTGTATDGFGNTDTLFNIERARGTALGDTFIGSGANNEFRGLGGADTFDGAGGSDLLRYDSDSNNGGTAGVTVTWTAVGSGTAIDGFGATDTFSNMEGVVGTAGADTFVGAGGNEDFYGLQGNDSLNGGAGFDWVRYDRDFNYGVITGVVVNLATGTATDGFGNTDTLTAIEGVVGTTLNDSITGNGSDNSFWANAGIDTINGGDGYDTIFYSNEAQLAGVNANLQTGIVSGGAGGTDSISGIEAVFGGNLDDTLVGASASEDLFGNGGNDSLKGNDGGDFMRGGGGNDTLDGTAGALGDMSSGEQDWAAYNDFGAATGVVVNLDTGIATDAFGGTDTLIDIERVRGSNLADNLSGSNTANLRQERFEGLGGNDTINGRAGFDVVSYQSDRSNGGLNGVTVNLATGTATDGFGATDTLSNIEGILGTDFADSMTGNAANNTFRVRGGADTVDGGDGQDDIDLYFSDQIGGTGANVNMAAGTALLQDGATVTFTSIEVMNGSYANDTIAGGTGNDNLNGDFGADSITGGAGDDTIQGGKGVDTLDGGGGGSDWISYIFDLTEPAALAADASRNAAFGWNTQNWTWTGVTVNLATNTMSGFDGAVDVISNFENIAGTYLADTLTGDAGNNRFRGYSGNDTIDGGAGSDTVVYSRNASRTSDLVLDGKVGEEPLGINVNLTTGVAQAGTSGTDTLTSIENVVATAGNDTLVGNASVNSLTGGGGDDTLIGGAGDDTLDGGTGIDTADYSGEVAAVGAYLTAAYASGTSINTDSLIGIENLSGGSGDDYLYGDGLANRLDGNGGNDVLDAGDNSDTINGGAGADLITAGQGNDTVNGGSEDDVIYGTAGNDLINGDAGNDVLSGGFGAFTLNGGAGTDLLYADGSAGSSVSGGADADYLIIQTTGPSNYAAADIENWFGYTGADTLNATGATTLVYMRGDAGNDSLTGGSAGDYLFGDGNNDTLIGGDGNDVLIGGAGADSLSGGNNTDVLYVDAADTSYNGGAGIDYLIVDDPTAAGISLALGSAQIEWVTGRSGNDVLNANGALHFVELLGDAGNDQMTAGTLGSILLGGNGLDTMTGGAGTDHMVGGSDADTFRFVSNGGTDYIYDFVRGADAMNLAATGLTNFAQLTINTSYAAANWYGVSYGTGTTWVNTGATGALATTDFFFV